MVQDCSLVYTDAWPQHVACVVSIGWRGEDREVDEGVVWVIHVIGMHTKSPSADVT